VASLTPNPEKTMLKPSALQVLIKFFNDVCWQVFAKNSQVHTRNKLKPAEATTNGRHHGTTESEQSTRFYIEVGSDPVNRITRPA
jgi:D-tyrosyl-tRNA(Tyr) deacylase